MITTITLSNGKEIYEFLSSGNRPEPKIKLENRFAVELALGKLLEDFMGTHTNVKVQSINHYEDNGDLIENIPFHNKEKEWFN